MENNSNTDIELSNDSGQTASKATARTTSRRQFLKGTSLALPAVMTLHSGTAQAITSITCGAKALAAQQSATCLTTGSDGRYRLSVNCYDKLVTKKINGKTVKVGNGTPTYFLGKKPSGTGGVVDCWRDMSGNEVLDTSLVNKSGSPCATRQAIVHISCKDGSIQAVGSSTAPTNTIITSAAGLCMASLIARGGTV